MITMSININNTITAAELFGGDFTRTQNAVHEHIAVQPLAQIVTGYLFPEKVNTEDFMFTCLRYKLKKVPLPKWLKNAVQHVRAIPKQADPQNIQAHVVTERDII